MTDILAIQKLKSWQGYKDKTRAKIEADDILVRFIKELGYHRVAEEWKKIK